MERPPAARLALQPLRHRPIATWILIGLNIAVWLLMTAMGGSTDPRVLVLFGAKVNELIVQGQLWRLVTPIFVHIGIVHLAFNTYAIYVFGSQIERFFGTARFVGLYLLSGIAGVLASFSLSPHPSAGASSAIFGLIGTEAAFFYRYRNAFGRRGQQRLYNILIVIGYNLAFTFVASNIDVWGHLGGLVVGAVLSWWLMPRYAIVAAEQGPKLVDRNRPRQWITALLIAVVSLMICSLLAVSLRAAQYTAPA
jgi:rhomboid protease GluP